MWFGYVSFGYIADAIGRKPAYVTFVLMAALLLPLYGALREPWMLLLLGPAVAFFGTGYYSGFGAVIAELYPTSVRATAAGVGYNVGRIASAAAPVVVGLHGGVERLRRGVRGDRRGVPGGGAPVDRASRQPGVIRNLVRLRGGLDPQIRGSGFGSGLWRPGGAASGPSRQKAEAQGRRPLTRNPCYPRTCGSSLLSAPDCKDSRSDRSEEQGGHSGHPLSRSGYTCLHASGWAPSSSPAERWPRGRRRRPRRATPAEVQDQTTTLDDQTELAITVYNSDLALIRDVRQLQLARGTGNLRFMDIAATVNPATVHFRSLTEPSRVSVLEQNYEYDLLEPDKLLRKYVGRDVTLVRSRQEDGSTVQEEVTARLLSYNNAPVWRIGNEIVTGMHADHIRFPELPETLFSRPTLIWTVENEGAARHRVEASYLAGKLAWNADYVLTVSREDKAADVNGWVTLSNNSGTAFRNAKLQLVAGDLNRVRQA